MASTINKAIILAAGRGSRLRGVLKGKPKPLLKIGGTTLIERAQAAKPATQIALRAPNLSLPSATASAPT